MRGASDSQLREYSRDIAAHTLKQLVHWRCSLQRLSNEQEQEQEQEQANGDRHYPKGAHYDFSVRVYVETENMSSNREPSVSTANCCECLGWRALHCRASSLCRVDVRVPTYAVSPCLAKLDHSDPTLLSLSSRHTTSHTILYFSFRFWTHSIN
jgi:hypothetical protein